MSPDGRWLAYSSDRGGSAQVYVRSWPELEGETRISSGDVEVNRLSNLHWAPDSGTLYYQVGEQLVAADVRSENGLVVEGRRTLAGQMNVVIMSVQPDGRFLVAEPVGRAGVAEPGGPGQLVVVTNWFTRLKERLSGG